MHTNALIIWKSGLHVPLAWGLQRDECILNLIHRQYFRLYGITKLETVYLHFTPDHLHCQENSNQIESDDLLHIIVRKPTSHLLSKWVGCSETSSSPMGILICNADIYPLVFHTEGWGFLDSPLPQTLLTLCFILLSHHQSTTSTPLSKLCQNKKKVTLCMKQECVILLTRLVNVNCSICPKQSGVAQIQKYIFLPTTLGCGGNIRTRNWYQVIEQKMSKFVTANHLSIMRLNM